MGQGSSRRGRNANTGRTTRSNNATSLAAPNGTSADRRDTGRTNHHPATGSGAPGSDEVFAVGLVEGRTPTDETDANHVDGGSARIRSGGRKEESHSRWQGGGVGGGGGGGGGERGSPRGYEGKKGKGANKKKKKKEKKKKKKKKKKNKARDVDSGRNSSSNQTRTDDHRPKGKRRAHSSRVESEARRNRVLELYLNPEALPVVEPDLVRNLTSDTVLGESYFGTSRLFDNVKQLRHQHGQSAASSSLPPTPGSASEFGTTLPSTATGDLGGPAPGETSAPLVVIPPYRRSHRRASRHRQEASSKYRNKILLRAPMADNNLAERGFYFSSSSDIDADSYDDDGGGADSVPKFTRIQDKVAFRRRQRKAGLARDPEEEVPSSLPLEITALDRTRHRVRRMEVYMRRLAARKSELMADPGPIDDSERYAILECIRIESKMKVKLSALHRLLARYEEVNASGGAGANGKKGHSKKATSSASSKQ